MTVTPCPPRFGAIEITDLSKGKRSGKLYEMDIKLTDEHVALSPMPDEDVTNFSVGVRKDGLVLMYPDAETIAFVKSGSRPQMKHPLRFEKLQRLMQTIRKNLHDPEVVVFDRTDWNVTHDVLDMLAFFKKRADL